jgi:Protein of unknown function (DUF1348)
LKRKWAKEPDYRLIKELWAFEDNRIAVRFAYEWHDDCGNWYRSYGNENWEFNERGLMRRRIASINDLPISEGDHTKRWSTEREAGQPSGTERTRSVAVLMTNFRFRGTMSFLSVLDRRRTIQSRDSAAGSFRRPPSACISASVRPTRFPSSLADD